MIQIYNAMNKSHKNYSPYLMFPVVYKSRKCTIIFIGFTMSFLNLSLNFLISDGKVG